jgi:hypothetical protein
MEVDAEAEALQRQGLCVRTDDLLCAPSRWLFVSGSASWMATSSL